MLRGPFRHDRVRHFYSIGGTPVPGIHAVLRAGGLEKGGPWFVDEVRERGKAVHAATLAYDLGEDAVIEDRWRGFYEAYVALRAAVRCRWRLLEHPKAHRRLRYATMLDRVGTVSGRPSVVEIKTGEPAPFHGPQLAGADLLLGPRIAPGTRRRLGFYLHADGTFQVKEYTEAKDYHDFLAALSAYWDDGGARKMGGDDDDRLAGDDQL